MKQTLLLTSQGLPKELKKRRENEERTVKREQFSIFSYFNSEVSLKPLFL